MLCIGTPNNYSSTIYLQDKSLSLQQLNQASYQIYFHLAIITFLKKVIGKKMIKIIMSIGLLLIINLSANLLDDGLAEYEKGNKKLASELYTEACDTGDRQACLNLGILYFTGDGVEQDKMKAKNLFTKTCKSRFAKGCFRLGVLYNRGFDGLKQDQHKAKLLFGKSCNIGYERACEQFRMLDKRGI